MRDVFLVVFALVTAPFWGAALLLFLLSAALIYGLCVLFWGEIKFRGRVIFQGPWAGQRWLDPDDY